MKTIFEIDHHDAFFITAEDIREALLEAGYNRKSFVIRELPETNNKETDENNRQ